MITKLLKGEKGFECVVVTDALGMGGMLSYHEDKLEMYIGCFNAGCDMMPWPSTGCVESILKAVETGEVSMERLLLLS